MWSLSKPWLWFSIDVTVTLCLHINLVTEFLPLALLIFLHPDPRIRLDMTSYGGTEDGGGSTVTVCAVLENVVAMTMGGPEETTSDISTSFVLTDGSNAGKNYILGWFLIIIIPPHLPF